MKNQPLSWWLRPTLMSSAVVLNLVGGLPVKAQAPTLPPGTNLDSLPQTPLPNRQERPQLQPLPSVDELLDNVPQRPEGAPAPDSELTFEVKEFRLEGNTVLPEAKVQAVFKPYRDRSLSFADLLEIEGKLTELYVVAGYINSGVVVPTQDIEQGLITFQAIEGKVEDIDVTVNGRLEESYVKSRLARGVGEPLNIDELQESLQLLQLNPLIESLNAELSVGQSRDRWRLAVEIDQGNEIDPVLFVNNSRTPSVGSVQRGAELSHNNLLGYADRLSFAYKNTDGSNDFDTSYNVPLNAKDGTLGLRYRYVDSDIIEGNFESVNIESETDELEFTFRQPLLLTANSDSTQEFALGLEFSQQSNLVTVQGEPFPQLSPGADENGETRISALRFFQDWTRRTRKDVFAARSQLSAGLDIFDATENVGLPDGKFVSWRGQVQWLRQLESSSNINLLLRSDIQLSSDDLVPLERFSLGGIDSVRGYRQDALLGDAGILASAEVRIPFYRWSQGQSSLSAVPFFDFGTVWRNSDSDDQAEDTLVSLGLGLRLDLSDTLSARLDYGIPLIDVPDNDDSLQEDGIYFSLDFFPF